MNDAIALLAISQMVCLGAMLYLYSQMQSLRKQAPVRRVKSARVASMPHSVQVAARTTTVRAAQQAYGGAAGGSSRRGPVQAFAGDAAAIASRMSDLGMDVPSLARRMQRSEEEVRLLLRRKGLAG